MLKVDKINAFYGQLQVLWDVSFEIEEGEIVALIGPNGAGKSTTLKAISGVIHPKSGHIAFIGSDITRLPPHKIVELGIVLQPEGRGLFPNMTIQENLEMGAFSKRARSEMKKNLDLVYKLFPWIMDRRKQLAGTLSGGEQQMVAIAKSLMASPMLLMLDEPSQGLAPKIVSQLFDVIKRINEEAKTAILLVEQNIHYALELCSRAYILEEGRIVQHGVGKELLKDSSLKERYLGIKEV